MNKYKNVVTKLESKSLEEIIIFLRSYSSKLGKKEEHCRDLMDKEKNLAFISSVLASGLTVINNITYHPTMSEDIYLKAMNIIGYTKNNRNHNYTTDEIMFTLGYIALYYKKTTDYRSVG